VKTNAWVQTVSGKAFYPFEPTADMICIEDIAHGLSHLCRFAGQTRDFYSVAQHSIMVNDVLATFAAVGELDSEQRRRLRLAALLHDAAEAFIVDLPTPIKAHVGGYKELELGVMAAVAKRFDIDPSLFEHPLVKLADMTMLATEKRDLLGPEPQPWIEMPKPYGVMLRPWTSAQAKKIFLEEFERFGGKS
jgi:hypothetical protein